MALFFSYSGLLIDLLAVPLLLWKRTKVIAFSIMALFHLMNSQLWEIGVFPWLMISGTLLYFSPGWPHRIIRFFWKTHQTHAFSGFQENVTLSPAQKAGMAILLTYFLVQFLLPFRHFLYPGNVHWTEEGHRFAWHMMVRDKMAKAKFGVLHDGGKSSEPKSKLTLAPNQARIMPGRPDMILQWSYHTAEYFREQGYKNVEVRAQVKVSLNGRKPQLFIDPDINLAAQPRNLLPAPWILPLVEPLPISKGD